MKKAISILLIFLIVVEPAFQSVVLGFQCQYASIRAVASARRVPFTMISATQCAATPTVKNPLTKRKIQIGGTTYNDFMKQGGWVQHEGTLKRLDLEALRDFQHGKIKPDTISVTSSADASTTEKWFTITPSEVSDDIIFTFAKTNPLSKQLLFVNKPSGLHCVPSRDLSADSLSAQVSSIYGDDVKPCHRLDRDTSGIIVFGLTADAHRDVSKQFEARTTAKTYVALVAGHPKQDFGTIDLPIGKIKTQEGFNRWTIGGDKPREAITEWRVEETFTVDGANFTKVLLKPKTGRGHQLRLHMKAIGHPILGDTIHGEGEVATCSPRLCLHAVKLQIDWNGARLEAETVAPF